MQMEKKLYNQLIKGDERALEVLYDYYFAALAVYATRFIPDEDVCTDIVHESFIRLWEKRKQFGAAETIVPFLYTCVRNACLNELRHRNIKHAVLEQQPSSLHLGEEVLENEIKRVVWSEIAKLPGDFRNIMSMTLEGYSIKEISEEMKLSEQTIKNKKGDALKQLRRNMGPYQWCLRLFF